MKAVAKLRNYPTSPFKMRLLADVVRGMKVEEALVFLEHHPRSGATPMRKLLLSALSNWKAKNPGVDEQGVGVSMVRVDGARSLRRMLPAPQGRAYQIKKRSNHVTIEVDVLSAQKNKSRKAASIVAEAKLVASPTKKTGVKAKKTDSKKTSTKKATTAVGDNIEKAN